MKNYEIHNQSIEREMRQGIFLILIANKENIFNRENKFENKLGTEEKNDNFVFKSRIKHFAITPKKAYWKLSFSFFRFIIFILKENLWFLNSEISH